MSLLVILLKTGPLKKEQERGVSTYALALIRGEDVACVDIESAPPRSKDKIQAQVGRRDTSKPRYFGDADPSPEAILSHLNYFLGVYLFISLNLILLCPPPPTLSPNSSLILLIRPYHL